MLSVIIPTHESERQVVRTLACLVSGATAGLVREVILADAGSDDEIEKVADLAGCRFMVLSGPAGARIEAAAKIARGSWLLFLRPGAVLDPDWVSEVQRFLMDAGNGDAFRAAAFRPVTDSAKTLPGQFLQLARQALGGGPQPGHGLLLAKITYEQLGGPTATSDNPELQLIRKIGRRRIAVLRSCISCNFN
jgi:glycosyltransferase involved in cell wall biosynthesis